MLGTRKASELPDLEPDEMWEKYLPQMRDMATMARQRSRQYRGFHTGAAALVMKIAKGKRVYGFLTGANRKFVEGVDPDRLCAEMEIMDTAFRGGWTWIVGFVFYGPHQADDACSVDLRVLIMCGHCRNDVRSLHEGLWELVTADTKFFSHNVETSYERLLCVGETLELCGGPHDPAIEKYPPRHTRAWAWVDGTWTDAVLS